MPNQGAVDVAVVIGTKNRGDKVVAAVVSILASDTANIELVVVDQSDNDDTAEAVARFAEDPRFLYVHSTKSGLSQARNDAIDLTSAPFIAITDDDCLVPPNWARMMTEPFRTDPTVGVVFGSVVPLEPHKPGHTPAVLFPKTRTVHSVSQMWWANRRGLCLGASMAVRRSTFESLGGFDPHLGAGAQFGSFEDNDLSWRCMLSGERTHLTNEVEVVHDGHRDINEVRALIIRDFYGVGAGVTKYLRTYRLGILMFIGAWLFNFGVVGPLQDVLAGRRPRGFRRPYEMLRGIRAGLSTPLDKQAMLFEPREQRRKQHADPATVGSVKSS